MSEELRRKVTVHQRDLMRHALGLNRATLPYRNYFAVEPSGPDFEAWEQLEAMGLAMRGKPRYGDSLVYFHVTEIGEMVAD